METELKNHWEHVYETKQPHQVSWTQDVPQTSIDFINSFSPNTNDRIIDVGGGDSKLVDYLLGEGFTNITVLDISAKAIERAKIRLADKADFVKWVISDINTFQPEHKFDIWHDRAAFHFLTQQKDIQNYTNLVGNYVQKLIVGTFSVDGPLKCSGLEITQYDEDKMSALFEPKGFVKKQCLRVDHTTPSGALQNFQFCSFTKIN